MKPLTSLQNPLVKHLVKLRKDGAYRKECDTLVVEGKKLVQDVCQKKAAKTLLVLEGTEIPEGVCADEIFVVPQTVLDKIAGAKTADQMLAEVIIPKQAKFDDLNRLLVLDRVSDPGNMGTLLRTALALGWDGVFFVEGSCDPFNDKALRAAKGATFRIPFSIGSWEELKKIIDKLALHLFAADIEGQRIEELDIKDKICLVLGNEAKGLSEEAHNLCQRVTIPISKETESLNVGVAGAILMYAMRNL